MGKTTLLNELHARGMTVIPEIVRELIQEQQAIDGEALPWKNKKRFMDTMFQRSIESFEKAITDCKGKDPIFFDRGFLDALCYAALEDIPIAQEMKTVAKTNLYNSKVDYEGCLFHSGDHSKLANQKVLAMVILVLWESYGPTHKYVQDVHLTEVHP